MENQSIQEEEKSYRPKRETIDVMDHIPAPFVKDVF
jgi:hypothetical protein